MLEWPILLLLALQDPAPEVPRVTQTVVVSASSEPVPLDSLARAVTILTREELARLPAWSIADALRLTGSVQVRSRGGFGAQNDFSVRGGGFGGVVVLVDGVRLNDSQSGHHNADIPVALDRIERIEVLRGTGSSLYGADAVAGAINIVTREGGADPVVSIAGGEYGLVRGSAAGSIESRGIVTSLAGWGTRTSGFMFDREVATGGASVDVALTARRRIAVSHLRNAFGANGFYGPSPSKEWTDQTLVSFGDAYGPAPRRVATRVSYRTHGDHFLWDVNRPGFAENRHRSHAARAGATYTRTSGRNVASVGAEAGMDWLRSNNLGDRAFGHGAFFAELQRRFDRLILYPAVRYDRYSSFGGSWSPSLAAVVPLTPRLRARATAGRAFRAPTFTERYYRDPAHLARSDLAPERAWGYEGGLDWSRGPWIAGITAFARRETDVIDWVRDTPQQQWRTANIRHVNTHGLEAGATGSWRRGFTRVEYTWLRSEAPHLAILSKYISDYAPRSLAASGAIRISGATWLGLRADCRQKIDARSYCAVDARASRAFGRFELFVEGTNLFDVSYQEIRGVDMPPRWLAAGVRVGRQDRPGSRSAR